MSTITAILEPSPDGTLHLPVPAEWRHRPIRVKAELEPVAETVPLAAAKPAKAGVWKNLPGTLWLAPDFDAPLEDFKDYMG